MTKIGTVEIGKGRVYIIAEAGVNHNGDIDLAKKLIDAAKEAGADAVKFQTFTTDELVTEEAAQAEYQSANTGVVESQAAMLKRLELSHEQFRVLKEYAQVQGIEFLSTPFSFKDADALHALSLAAFKVSSGDLTHLPFLTHLAHFGKPVIISTGMATLTEVSEAVETLIDAKAAGIVILQCTSEYPTPPRHANLRVIETLSKTFRMPVGFSDHTEEVETNVYAASLGAVLVEKHFTLDRRLEGPDHLASLLPHELKDMIERIRKTPVGSVAIPEEFLGSPEKTPTNSEKVTAKLVRKGIAARRDIKAGTTLSVDDIFIARPEGLILPKEWGNVLGKRAKENIAKGTSLSWDMIK